MHSGAQSTPVYEFPKRRSETSSNPRQQPPSLHRGVGDQQAAWRMTKRQSVCEWLGNAPGNANSDCVLEGLHGVVLLRMDTSTATNSRTTEELLKGASAGLWVVSCEY